MRYALKKLDGSDEDGNLEIDNNATERAIRGVAVGRNNWFKEVLSRIASHPITRLTELLPHNWTPAQS